MTTGPQGPAEPCPPLPLSCRLYRRGIPPPPQPSYWGHHLPRPNPRLLAKAGLSLPLRGGALRPAPMNPRETPSPSNCFSALLQKM